MSKVSLTLEQREKFNRYFVDQEQRNIAMSIFSSINYWQDKEIGFLPFSLDKLYKKYKNKFYLTLSNFKKISNKLVELGFLKTMNKGRLKFYGTSDCKSNDDIRAENENLKKENEELKQKLGEIEILKKEIEELKNQLKGDINVVDKVEDTYECSEASQDVVIQTAYDMMKEIGIEYGSIPFRQVIESLYDKTDKGIIHNKGLINYIKKVIHNKVHNQAKFREVIKNERKNPRKVFMTKADKNRIEDLEKKLLGWNKEVKLC